MTAFSIVAAILAFFIFLLLCPVFVHMTFEESFSVRVRFLFLYFYFPRPAKGEGKQKQKKAASHAANREKKKDKTSSIREIIKEKGVSGFIDLLQEFARLAVGAAKKVCRHLVIDRFYINICVKGEDAADTAIQCGCIGAAVYPAAGAVIANIKCKDHDIRVVPCFAEEEKGSVHFESRLKIRLLFIFSAVFSALFHYIKYAVLQKREKG